MASFGGTTCTFVKGKAAAKKQRVETWQQAGYDGYGAQKLGLGNSESRFVLVHFDTVANARTWIGLIEAMQGTLVTVVDDDGESVPLFLVQRVSPPRITAADQGSGEVRAELQVFGVVT